VLPPGWDVWLRMTSTSDLPRGEASSTRTAESNLRPLSASVQRGALWLVASNLSLKLANLLLVAIVAHILSPHDFGVFTVALTVYAIVTCLSMLGVSACLIRADLDIDSLAPTVATVCVLSSTIIAAAMVAFARPIAVALGSAEAAGPIRVMAIAVMLLAVFAVPSSQLVRDFKQDKIFLANAISFVPSTALLIMLAKSGGGAMAFAWSTVAGQFVAGCVMTVAAPRRYRPGLSRSALSVIFGFGIPMALGNFVNYILLNVDYAFVGHFLGATELGVYMLAYTIASWPYGLLGSVINNVAMPAFSRVKQDPEILKNAIARALRTVTLIVMPMCAMTMVLARPLVLTLYGAKWAASANVLVILSIYAVVSMACLLFANILSAMGRSKLFLLLCLIWLGALVPAMAVGVRQDGIIGAAYAHVAAIIPVVLPCYLLALKRVTGVRLTALGRAALPALLASSAAALAAHGAASQLNRPPAQLIAGLAAGGVVYLAFTGKHAVAVLGQRTVAERLLRLYRAATQLVAWPTDWRKYYGKDREQRAAEALTPAGPLHVGVLTDQERPLDARDTEDLVTPAYVTPVTRERAWVPQAVAVHQRILSDRELLLGPNHPETVVSRADLAHAYRRAGWLAKAIPLYERVLVDWQRLLGPDHPVTQGSSNYLASAYREAGQIEN
jgi:lipopolysaccharide exporter